MSGQKLGLVVDVTGTIIAKTVPFVWRAVANVRKLIGASVLNVEAQDVDNWKLQAVRQRRRPQQQALAARPQSQPLPQAQVHQHPPAQARKARMDELVSSQ